MRKTLLVVVCLLTFLCSKAQTYSSGHLHVVVADSIWHDSSICSSTCIVGYSITIDSSFVGDTVQIMDTLDNILLYGARNLSGVSPWIVSWSHTMQMSDDLIYAGAIRFDLPDTMKITSSIDTLGVSNMFMLPISNACHYNTVSGRVYVDNNSNCIFDAGDVPLHGLDVLGMGHFSDTILSFGHYGISNDTGYYTFQLQQSWLINYTVKFLWDYYSFIFPPSPCFSGSYVLTTLPQTNVDFPVQSNSSVDVQCAVLTPGKVRLGCPFYVQPYVSNTGGDTVSGALTFIKDSRVIYDSSLSLFLPDTVRGDTLIWNYVDLTNLSMGAYWNSFISNIYLIPDSSVVAGDSLCFRIYTGVPSTDINAANNDYSVCFPVVYSFDPNEKEVSPKGIGPEGFIDGHDTLTYTLHFQNTGSDMAYNVRVIDTLDNDINVSTFKILGASHNMIPQWLGPNIVEFDFNSIYLPDSFSNEPASHGSIRFSVALNHGIPTGTQIQNTGYIYFDSNAPVVTNTTLNTIFTATSVTTLPAKKPIIIYPNPATDNITVENLEEGILSIVNVNGVAVLQQDIANNKTTIDVSRLADGVYFLKAVNKDNTATTKFIKY